ncbi:hypothetical protein [Reticulibacter mediterranei]|uniref:hypothetical protein n=1 Tax=Reticulibacter mediterranei TaxID=2778369 RepID=UPI001F2FFAB7|nr:hypothetical protein [Reticulibacter mediterranei]
MDEHRSATCRLIRYVQQQSLFRPFVALAAEVGLDEKSVRTIFHNYVEELEQVMQQSTPRVLGLDELQRNGTTTSNDHRYRGQALCRGLARPEKSNDCTLSGAFAL